MPLLSGEKRVSTMMADGQAGRAAFTFLIEIVGLTRGGAAPVTRTWGIRHDGAAAASCRSLGRAPSPVPGGSGNIRAPHRTEKPCTHR